MGQRDCLHRRRAIRGAVLALRRFAPHTRARRLDNRRTRSRAFWSLFDRSVIGADHNLSVKHLPAYLDEAAFRWNNRGNPFLFRDTLLRLVSADSLTYRDLVGGA